ncbi:MAG: HAMP domain-containing histidine kinase [Chloroflexi bacterium]|nr:HAMP domain-containing histidine kinase [Chloroflexota bacterium]
MSDLQPPASVSQFLSLAMHDMRQPLNVLQMYLGILQSQAGIPDEDELSQVVDGSLRSLQSMLTLLANWARIEEEQFELHPASVTLSEWYRRIGSIAGIHYADTELKERRDDGAEDEREFDITLLTKTLEGVMVLLPEDSSLSLPTNTLWNIEIRTTESNDALYHLALVGGCKIMEALGFHTETQREGERIRLHAGLGS